MRKIQHIGEIADFAISECLMLEEITAQTKTYKFGTTDLSFTLCMEREIDDSGSIIGDCYVVQSLRDEDCFDKSEKVFDVKYIFMRPNNSELYKTMLFKDKNAVEGDIPETVMAMLAERLKATLKEDV